MHIITLATQKGGSGKSTLAACVAVAAESEGIKTAVLDTDPQGSVFKWGERREAETPAVDRCEPHQLAAVLKSLPKQGFELVIIDTAGAHNASVAPALQAADFCLVPVKPTLTDLEAAIPTAKQLRDRKTRFGFVLIPTLADQNPCAQSRNPRDMMRHGCSTSLFHASQQ